MQKQVYLDTTFKVKIDARTFQCQGCGGNNNSESIRSWNIYWTSWNSTTAKNCHENIFYTFFFFSKNNLLLYGLVPEFTPEIPSALNQRVHDLFRFNLGISRQIQLQKVRTETKIFNRQKKSDKKCYFRLRE